MSEKSLYLKNFLWQMGKIIVEDVAPDELRVYDNLAVSYIEEEDTGEGNKQHLSSDFTTQALWALTLLFPILRDYLEHRAIIKLREKEEAEVLSQLKKGVATLTIEVRQELDHRCRVTLIGQGFLKEDVTDILRAMWNFFDKKFDLTSMPYPMRQSTLRADVLILTPLSLELKAVMRYLEQQEEPEVLDQMAYEKGYFSGKKRCWRIVVAEPGMENTPTALALERGIRRFQPKIVLLLGIAGGVKNNVQIGDVVVGTKAYGYESGKEGAGEFWARPSVESFSRYLLAHATLCSRRDDWKKRAAQNAGDASVWFGPIAAGNKVITSKQSETYHRLKQHYENTLALDMESSGFAEALPNHREVHGLVIRGISDLLDHKGDDFQKTAADRAAAFAFELLYQLDDDSFTKEENSPFNAPTGSNIRIENSENVIVGGQYNITGDFHLGNKKG